MSINWKNYNYLLDKLTAYEDRGFEVDLIAYTETESKAYPTDELIKDFQMILSYYYKRYGNVYRITIKNPEINRVIVDNERYYRDLLYEFYQQIENKFEYCDGGTSLIIKDN